MARWEFVEWLLIWLLGTVHFEFEWDHGNKTKSATKHGVSVDEVEGVFKSGSALPLRVQIEPPADEQRLGVVGPGFSGRLLQVAFALREGRVRVIVPDLLIERKGDNMKKSYVKSLKEYKGPFNLDAAKILDAMKRYKNVRKKPTSVALGDETIEELKRLAEAQGIPYQVLIRVFVLDGLERLKNAA